MEDLVEADLRGLLRDHPVQEHRSALQVAVADRGDRLQHARVGRGNPLGQVGVVDHRCPHRCASLFLGRNEEGGIRCIYHGWKFDVAGNCVDMPSLPPPGFKEKVKTRAYKVVERAGVVWVYMGKSAKAPPLPAFELLDMPEDEIKVSFVQRDCNWLQALEGEIDSAHAPILHGRLDAKGQVNDWLAKRDLKPTFECIRQDFGMSIAARRRLDENTLYWRVNQFIMPFFTLVPPQSKPFVVVPRWM